MTKEISGVNPEVARLAYTVINESRTRLVRRAAVGLTVFILIPGGIATAFLTVAPPAIVALVSHHYEKKYRSQARDVARQLKISGDDSLLVRQTVERGDNKELPHSMVKEARRIRRVIKKSRS